ncbi:hypothetical protein ABGB12_31265 [Actinocorallia sp. B10E7]|uniref:SCO4848 family membrane protein n=1 Tax=Actinocorallia sp. B10E7 TaxID=3153558 RepID=UPI00325DF9D4
MTSRRSAVFLLALAAFMAFEWMMLAKNLGSGPRRATAFYVIHYILAAVNVVFAAILARIGWKSWKKAS